MSKAPMPPLAPATALFLPASNPRAIDKARGLSVDLVLLDLEDAVAFGAKEAARAAAVEVASQGVGGKPVAIRLNGVDTAWHDADVTAVAASGADFAVLPKVDDADTARRVALALGKPLLAMIETPAGVLSASAIAATPGVCGLIAGTNDLKVELGIPAASGREGLALALQTIVLAARAAGAWALDGVYNALDDEAGLAAECRQGRAFGFDGKTLIHPNQIAVAAAAFAPDDAEIAEARALIAAATGGAERFDGRMIEAMHVAQARQLLLRAGG